MNNLEDPANTLLTAKEPTAPDGASDGTNLAQPLATLAQPEGSRGSTLDGSTQLETSGSLEPEKTVSTASSAAERLTQAAQLLGIPDTLPMTWCPNCKADVLPKDKGRCPRCARMLKGSFLARRHPVNLLRRDALLAKLVADYQPNTTMQHATCQHLAGTLEQLEVIKPGSQEWQRLTQMAQQLAEALEETRASRKYTTTSLEDLSPNDVVARAERVLQMARLVRDATRERDSLTSTTDPASMTSVNATAPSTFIQQATLAPEPRCPYGCGTLAECAELKETRPDVWATFHGRDPEVIQKKNDEATAVMMRRHDNSPRW
jgi:hypothetical protein